MLGIDPDWWSSLGHGLLFAATAIAASGLIAFFGAKLLEAFLSGLLTKFKEDAVLARETEVSNLNSQLRMREMQSGALHDRRLIVIADLYERLADANDAMAWLVNPLQIGNEPSLEDKAKEATRTMREFIRHFHRNRIWLPEDVCVLIQKLQSDLHAAGIDWMMREEIKSGWANAWKTMEKEIPPIRELIEQRFRELADPADQTLRLPSDPG